MEWREVVWVWASGLKENLERKAGPHPLTGESHGGGATRLHISWVVTWVVTWVLTEAAGDTAWGIQAGRAGCQGG